MKIYTRAGDDGSTGLYGGDRVAKTSVRIQAIGDVDELNACLGVARALSTEDWSSASLATIQGWLFEFGAEIAAPPGSKFQETRIRPEHVVWLEEAIDEVWNPLPPLKAFILPGGSSLSAQLHFCRAVCRRTERSVFALDREEPVGEAAKRFLNRLSDWLFAAARTANANANVPDLEWHPSKEI